jgi:hypothetical protein
MREFVLPAMREDRGRFAALRNERVFTYWPHGLGDWAQVAAILPLFEPSNAYAIARFGDDYSSLLEGNAYVRVLRSGILRLGDGSSFGAKDLGLQQRRLDGSVRRVMVPHPLADDLADFAPTAMLWTDYPETEGRTPFPFQSKARNLARLLVSPERLAGIDVTKPLATTVDVRSDPMLQASVDLRLGRFAPSGARRLLLSVSGYTAERKNWDLAQARAFVALVHRDDPRSRVIVMEDPALGKSSAWPGREIVAGYRELFSDLDTPFARVFLALLKRVDAMVGVPAGPLHVAMIHRGFPIVGLWLAHLPEWYDEPNPDAVHLIGSYPSERRFDRRPATTTLPMGWHRKTMLDRRTIPAEAVIAALKV